MQNIRYYKAESVSYVCVFLCRPKNFNSGVTKYISAHYTWLIQINVTILTKN